MKIIRWRLNILKRNMSLNGQYSTNSCVNNTHLSATKIFTGVIRTKIQKTNEILWRNQQAISELQNLSLSK